MSHEEKWIQKSIFTQIISRLCSVAKIVIDVLIRMRWPRIRSIRRKQRTFRVLVLVVVITTAAAAAAATARTLPMRWIIIVVVVVARVIVVAFVGILSVGVVFVFVARFIGGIFAGARINDACGGDPWIFCARW